MTRNTEPDYIKIYTGVWRENNQIPEKWRPLFMELATRMAGAEPLTKSEADGGQLVYTREPYKTYICNALGIQSRQYQRGLADLCRCNAVKKVSRGVYQVNPQYAVRGK